MKKLYMPINVLDTVNACFLYFEKKIKTTHETH